MRAPPSEISNWLLGPEPVGEEVASHLWPRWLFLRALGLIYFSAFYSLLFQIKGLIGPEGLLPAGDYLQAAARYAGAYRYWFAPTLFWFSSGDHALMLVCWVGLIASVLLFLNVMPRGMLLVCFVTFLSFVAAAQDFSGYQSDGMLLSAGFISLFFAPPGFRPGLGRASAPSRASLFLLQLVWFTIYFESGLAKILGGDPEWRNFTAMDEYYQNGPLPTWVGWYAQQLPHWFHTSTVFLTLAIELVIVWMLFLPRRFRVICFFIVTPFEIGIILTANYTFLNYLVLSLGILLLDDRFLGPLFRQEWLRWLADEPGDEKPGRPAEAGAFARARRWTEPCRRTISGFCLGCTFYGIAALLVGMVLPMMPLPRGPLRLLEPFRIANRYGLFGIMTRGRYEIEFQGTRDAKTWSTYPFRYKPQDLSKPPGIYAPYQPRFDWNLWFATLGPWREYPFVVYTEERLLKNSPDVLALFAGNPFPDSPPQKVRAVIWQYWFSSLKEKRESGMWWRRELLGLYAPALERTPDGKISIVESSVVAPTPTGR